MFFVCFSINLSAATRAGLLVRSCGVTCFTIHGEISGSDGFSIDVHNLSFGMLVAPTLAPWGPSRDAGGLGSTRKEIFGVQAWISIDFGRISEPPFGRFWPTLAQQLCFLACVFAGHVF